MLRGNNWQAGVPLKALGGDQSGKFDFFEIIHATTTSRTHLHPSAVTNQIGKVMEDVINFWESGGRFGILVVLCDTIEEPVVRNSKGKKVLSLR
jgi:hypothetical protein